MFAGPFVDNFALHIEKQSLGSSKWRVESVAFEGSRVIADETAILGGSVCSGR